MGVADGVGAGGQRLLRRQNDPRALRLLVAQRRFYRRGHRWSYCRLTGLSTIAVAAPLVTAFLPAGAPVAGAVAGGYVFLAKTLFSGREASWRRQGAAVQEQFDEYVFELPPSRLVTHSPTPEAVADVLRGDLDQAISSERVRDWYPVSSDAPHWAAIAIAQRSNAAYSEVLLRRHADLFLAAVVLWSAVAVAISLASQVSATRFVAGVALPLLPALLGAFDLYRDARKAADDRSALASGIEAAIRAAAGGSITVDELRRFQDHLYLLRRDGPLVPEFLYRRFRARNNAAMEAAALELSDVVTGRHAGG